LLAQIGRVDFDFRANHDVAGRLPAEPELTTRNRPGRARSVGVGRTNDAALAAAPRRVALAPADVAAEIELGPAIDRRRRWRRRHPMSAASTGELSVAARAATPINLCFLKRLLKNAIRETTQHARSRPAAAPKQNSHDPTPCTIATKRLHVPSLTAHGVANPAPVICRSGTQRVDIVGSDF